MANTGGFAFVGQRPARQKRKGFTWGGPNTIGALRARQFGFNVGGAQKAPAAPGAPGIPGVGGASAGPSGPQIDPTAPLADDAQAAAARAQAIFDATQKRAELVSQGAYSAADLDEAIRRLHGQRPDAENQATNNANAAGLASSGYLAKNLGDIAANFVRQESDARNDYGRSEANRQSQLAALAQQQTLAQAAIDAELADRQATRDEQAAAAGGLNAVKLPKQVSYKDLGVYGLTIKAKGNKFVVVDRSGREIPGATLHIAGKRRFVRIPGGT